MLSKLIAAILLFVILSGANPVGAQGEQGRSITLLEAVAQTLENQPNVLLQKQEVLLAGGKLQLRPA